MNTSSNLTISMALIVALTAFGTAQSGTFTTTGSLSTPRELHTETTLSSGNVLVAGGGR